MVSVLALSTRLTLWDSLNNFAIARWFVVISPFVFFFSYADWHIRRSQCIKVTQ